MKHSLDSSYYNFGRILVSSAFVFKAIEFISCLNSVDKGIPSYFESPVFLTITLALIWLAAGLSFLFQFRERIMSVIVSVVIVFILLTSTSRGFHEMHDISSTLLKFSGWICLMGGALLIGSCGNKNELPQKGNTMFETGRILIGFFFLIAGILHFANVSTDAEYVLHGFPAARFWVVFSGICWVLCAIAYWFNLTAKLATLGVIILVGVITFMVNLRGFESGKAWEDMSKVFSNLALIGACLMLASKGFWWFKCKVDSPKNN